MIVMCYVFNFLTIYALMIYCPVPYVKLMKFIYKKNQDISFSTHLKNLHWSLTKKHHIFV